MSQEQAPATEPQSTPLEFAKVELMGHRQRVGQIQEVTRFGVTLLRVDFWDTDTLDMATEFYAGSALYCVSPVTKEVVDAYEAKQKSYYEPRLRQLPSPDEDDDPHEIDHDEDHSSVDDFDDF